MAQSIDTWTRLLQQHRDALATARAGQVDVLQLSDEFGDKLEEFERIRRASREMLEATTSVNHEVMKIVSDNLRALLEKTPDPHAPWLQSANRNLAQAVVDSNRAVHDSEVLVRRTEALIRALRAAREEEV